MVIRMREINSFAQFQFNNNTQNDNDFHSTHQTHPTQNKWSDLPIHHFIWIVWDFLVENFLLIWINGLIAFTRHTMLCKNDFLLFVISCATHSMCLVFKCYNNISPTDQKLSFKITLFWQKWFKINEHFCPTSVSVFRLKKLYFFLSLFILLRARA